MSMQKIETTKIRSVKKESETVGLVKRNEATKRREINKALKAIDLVNKVEIVESYKVKKNLKTICLEEGWSRGAWREVPALDLCNYMGSSPVHSPQTQAKLLYDENNIYVHFCVEDQYVRAKADKYQDPVFKDSCVEFFFTPSEDITDGYFNIEINCCGVILMCHQLAKGDAEVKISNADLGEIDVHTSLKEKHIPVESIDPMTWTVVYKLPFKMLEKYAKVNRPAKGVVWGANFYKCADETSFPHWLTWSKIDKPLPDFHQPIFFGNLEFA